MSVFLVECTNCGHAGIHGRVVVGRDGGLQCQGCPDCELEAAADAQQQSDFVEFDCRACGTLVYVAPPAWALSMPRALEAQARSQVLRAVGEDGSRVVQSDSDGRFECPECETTHRVASRTSRAYGAHRTHGSNGSARRVGRDPARV